MPRALSLAARDAIFAQQSDQAFIILMTITHAQLAQPIRLARDARDVISQGQVYIGLPFDIVLPSDADDDTPQAQVTIDNISRQVVDAVRGLPDSPTIALSVVLSGSPDVVELGPLPFQIASLDADATTLTGTLIYEPILAEPFPCDSYVPAAWPSLFGGASAT